MRPTPRLLLLPGLAFLLSCSDPAPEPDAPLFNAPAHFPKPVYALERNPVTQAGFELGRTLFYDGSLSRDGSVSCGECHRQDFAFTHHGHDLSHGIDNLSGVRNSLPLQNLAWERNLTWDGGVFDLDLFPIVPIENPVEMDEKTGNVLQKLRRSKTYPALFKRAYGSDSITTDRFLKALSQFMLTLVSDNSRYDQFRRGEGVLLTDGERAGLTTFEQKCAGCHAGELFTDGRFRNNGLPAIERSQLVVKVVKGQKTQFLEPFDDLGRAVITERDADKYTFRVPSLRNVEVTKPYMHDGRFATLEQVLDHYAGGVSATPNLDPLLTKSGKPGIPLTDVEKRNLIAFLKTLTDHAFLTNPRFSPQ